MAGSRSPSPGPREEEPSTTLVEQEGEHDKRRGKGASGDEDKKRQVIDDSTQYKSYQHILYQLKDEPHLAKLSFPVSEDSTEAKRFQRHHNAILSRLDQEKDLDWCSVECLGRMYDGDKIRTTVVITCRERLEKKREWELTKNLQGLGRKTTESMDGFPFLFVKGKTTRVRGRQPDRLKFIDKQRPLVCGASCGIYIDDGSTRTIGGFVTIEGDPDKGAVYALTNHHVAVPHTRDPVQWMGFGSADDLLRWHPDVPVELRDRPESLVQLLDIRRSLNSSADPYPRHYGADGEAYVLAVTARFLQLQGASEEERARCLARVREMLGTRSAHNLQASLSRHGLEDLEGRLRRDMIMSPDTPADVVAAFVRGIFPLNSKERWDHVKSVLVDLLDRRNVARLLDTWLQHERPVLIVHPSQSDYSTILERLKEDQDHLRQGDGQLLASSLDRQNIDGELQQQITTAEAEANNPLGRIIGIVWASSGLGPRRDWPSPMQEDWALIKLFRANEQQFSNVFTKSPLRPNEAGDHFRAAKPWSHPTSVAVWKRGRTTNITIGRSNETLSSFRIEGDKTKEWSILPSPGTMYRGFIAAGDSGSWVMDRFGQLVGMVWGSNSGTRTAYFTPANYLFRWIERRFMTALDLHNLIGTLTTNLEPGQRIRILGSGGQGGGPGGGGGGGDSGGSGGDDGADDGQGGGDVPRDRKGSRSRPGTPKTEKDKEAKTSKPQARGRPARSDTPQPGSARQAKSIFLQKTKSKWIQSIYRVI